jgi:hypothetical protein
VAGGTTGQPESDMVIKLLTEAFTVPRLSVQHAAIHAWASLVEAKADAVVLATLSLAFQFILATSTPEIRVQPRLRTAALGCAFLVIEKLVACLVLPALKECVTYFHRFHPQVLWSMRVARIHFTNCF